MTQTASETVTVERKQLEYIRDHLDLARKRAGEVLRHLDTDELDSTCKCLLRGCLPDLSIAEYEVAGIKEMIRVLHFKLCDFLGEDAEVQRG